MNHVERYCQFGRLGVEGWLSRGACRLITTIDAAQRGLGQHGNVAEIGVHHGRLFILLLLLCREDENALAVDLFSDQSANIDGSGKGDEARLRANVRRHAGDRPFRIHRGDSTRLSGEALRQLAGGPIRIFSIDGGHVEDVTLSDLLAAQDALTEGGVVVLDDCFSEGWPGVVSGVARYMSRPERMLVPFAVGGNKTLFCRSEFVSAYRRALHDLPDRRVAAHLFGFPVTCFDFNRSAAYVWFRQTALWKAIEDTRIGGYGKWAYRKLITMTR